MNRQIIYTGQLPLSGQGLKGSKSIMKAIGQLVNDALLSTASPALLSGLSLVPTGPASMSLTLNPGTVYQSGQIDYVTTAGVGALTAYGSLAADATAIILQGIAATSQNITGFTAPGTTGQSTNFLIEFQVQTQDGTTQTLNYYNSANPLVPLIGPAGAGTQQATERSTVMAVQVLAGSTATTGSQVTPTITAGWLPGYVVTVAFGQTTILAGNIAVATGAPFLASLTSQHHLGIPGTAPQIDLTSEVKNLLPLANMSALGITNLTDLACSKGAGLVLNCNAGEAILNGVPTAIAANTITLPASSTVYVYVNNAGAVVSSVIGWPSSAFYPMAIAVTGASTITTITDKRGLAVVVAPSVATLTDLACSAGTGLSLNFNAGEAIVNGVPTAITASAITLTASATNYVYVNSSAAVAFSTTGWPSAAFYPLAVVVTGASTITSVTDKRGLAVMTAVTVTPFSPASRNAVQSALMDAATNGKANYLNATLSSSTSVDHKATAQLSAFSFGNGLNPDGTFNNVNAQLISDQAGFYGGLTSSVTNYLFIKNTAGVLSGIVGAYSQTIATAAPPNPAAIPTMTSNTAPSGTAFATSINSSTYDAWVAFSKILSSLGGWISSVPPTAGSPQCLGFDLGYAATATTYSIQFNSGSSNVAAPAAWTFQGWNGSAWITLDTQTGQTFSNSQLRSYTIASPASYLKYQASFTAIQGAGSYVIVGLMNITYSTLGAAPLRYYDPNQNKSFLCTGGAWVTEEVIPVGECVTNGSGQVTSYLPYAPLRRYQSGSVACAASTPYTLNHNIGHAGVIAEVFTSTDGLTWTPLTPTSTTRLTVIFTTPAGAAYYRIECRETWS
jgi:hypothetical protein